MSVSSIGIPIFGKAGHADGSPSSFNCVITWVSVGPYWLNKTHCGSAWKKRTTCGVIFNCSPAVITSVKQAGKCFSASAASVKYCKTTKGRNILFILFDSMYFSKQFGSTRKVSSTKTSVPPVVNVANISWKETSKLRGANCSVLNPTADAECFCCQANKFTIAA